ncbi:cytochrome b/b6 domain-containing protein [Jannaschia sp. LMIT008]|uniref:cytochrome b/b6 domain-containing protein n=1 Tax=Jannaschia maritima TaxID=3032585 RepID=UPI0028111F4C|nr:cytochrome b/b6 domain-containing protein [Jannaschia sp. LMIT008]
MIAATRRTEATNTVRTYGWVERAFHWTIAALMLTVIPLGAIAYRMPVQTDAQIERVVLLFSAHKTVGLAIFFVALARILWALSQPRPRPLHGGWEGRLAAAVHWLLYGSLVIVPLLGWTHHAAATGFAPIWWPFGQTLPFVPRDPDLSATLGTLHKTFNKVLVAALILHVAGAIKHAAVDRDATMARMWRGTDPGPLPERSRGHALPAVVALGVWAATLGVGLALVPQGAQAVGGVAQVDAPANWTVEDGTLSITVTQLGSAVTGSFADWQASIDFDDATGTGAVEVSVATGSLTLGSVSGQATGDEFLASGAFPTATFAADIAPAEDGTGHVAEGTLTIRDVVVPVTLPFDLDVEGDTATMSGSTDVDRRDFEMGQAYPDESNVGFGVTISVELTAQRGDGAVPAS